MIRSPMPSLQSSSFSNPFQAISKDDREHPHCTHDPSLTTRYSDETTQVGVIFSNDVDKYTLSFQHQPQPDLELAVRSCFCSRPEIFLTFP